MRRYGDEPFGLLLKMHQIFNPKKNMFTILLKKMLHFKPSKFAQVGVPSHASRGASLQLYNNQDDKCKIKWLDCFQFKVFKVKKAKLEN